ncbi:MAG: HAD family hydrolase [Candidatus Dormibacteraeota bacterium]|nr:HAD family hydrolase [Candidatus Dormibacteraeota bacterium]
MIPYRAVLFDFGDTLFASPDGVPLLVEAGFDADRAAALWSRFWAEAKSPASLLQGRDLSLEQHRRGWLQIMAPVEADHPGLAARLYDHAIAQESWLPYPDARPVLAALHAGGIRIGVVSNIPAALAPLFAEHGLGEVVDVYAESYAVGVVKPDLELFRSACERLRVSPAEALMVGDNPEADGAGVHIGLTALILPGVARGTERGLKAVLPLCGLAAVFVS